MKVWIILFFLKLQASEILYLSYKLSAEEAYNFGFVSKLFSDKDVDKVWSDLGKLSTLSQQVGYHKMMN